MGTRADFYVGRGDSAEWLGSTAWDGYPSGFEDTPIFAAPDEAAYRAAVAALADREDWTAPERGWPWPWEDSRTTDYAYAFDGGRVWASCFGRAWFDPRQPEPEEHDGGTVAVFPNMKARQNVTLGPRSGVMVIGPKGPENPS